MNSSLLWIESPRYLFFRFICSFSFMVLAICYLVFVIYSSIWVFNAKLVTDPSDYFYALFMCSLRLLSDLNSFLNMRIADWLFFISCYCICFLFVAGYGWQILERRFKLAWILLYFWDESGCSVLLRPLPPWTISCYKFLVFLRMIDSS